jgi:Na+-driven multidrug efflux pump
MKILAFNVKLSNWNKNLSLKMPFILTELMALAVLIGGSFLVSLITDDRHYLNTIYTIDALVAICIISVMVAMVFDGD